MCGSESDNIDTQLRLKLIARRVDANAAEALASARWVCLAGAGRERDRLVVRELTPPALAREGC
jgi:hypothetical protein